MPYKLFDFLKDEHYKLMLDIAKEMHNDLELVQLQQRYDEIDKNDFFKVCNEHELDGVVGEFLHLVGKDLPERWEKSYQKNKNRQEYLKNKAIEICNAMNENGIDMVILKNGGIMISMIPDAVKCPMEDIDSLIRKKDFYIAHKVLTDSGFVFKFRSEYEEDKLDEAYRNGSSEYYLTMPDGDKMWFELSWRAIDGRWIRPDKEPDTEKFIDRSFVAEGTKVHVLSPEDNLLQVCIHTAKHSYVRAPGLRLHMDVDRIVVHNEIDWNNFIKMTKETHVCKSTYLSLYIPSILFGTPIPQWVLDELYKKGIDKLLKMLGEAGLPHPHEKKFSKLQFLRFQTALYDDLGDLWHTLYPGKKWMCEKYACKNNLQLISAIIIRGLDLCGIRKRKSKSV